MKELENGNHKIEPLYRLEYEENKGQYHLEHLGRKHPVEENTLGWHTIFSHVSDREFKLFDSFVECHKKHYQLGVLDLSTMKDLASIFSEFARSSHERGLFDFLYTGIKDENAIKIPENVWNGERVQIVSELPLGYKESKQ